MPRILATVAVLVLIACLVPQAEAQERWFLVSGYSPFSVVTSNVWLREAQLNDALAAIERLRAGRSEHGYYDQVQLDQGNWFYVTAYDCYGDGYDCHYATPAPQP